MTEEKELTEEQKKEQELAKEKAQAWLISQGRAKRHLDKSALRKIQKEKEKEEILEMIDEAIDEITEGGEEESGEPTKEEE